MVTKILFILILILSFGSCGKESRPEAVVAPTAATPAEQVVRHESDPTTPEILKRPQATMVSHVKQVLVTYDRPNPRFPVPKRSISEAMAKVHEVMSEFKKGVPFDELVKKHSDDPETGPTADSMFMESEGTPGSTRQLALRLAVGEAGVVQTGNAYHIMLRVPEPAAVKSPDSTDLLARETLTKTAAFKSLNIAWRGLKQVYLTQITEGALNRSQAQAAQLAGDVLARIRAGDKFDDLITQFGEKIPMPEEAHNHDDHAGHDHGAHKHGPSCKHAQPSPGQDDHAGDDHAGHDHAGKPEGPPRGKPRDEGGLREVPEVGNLALRLQVGEAGIVTSRYGYHVVLRIR